MQNNALQLQSADKKRSERPQRGRLEDRQFILSIQYGRYFQESDSSRKVATLQSGGLCIQACLLPDVGAEERMTRV